MNDLSNPPSAATDHPIGTAPPDKGRAAGEYPLGDTQLEEQRLLKQVTHYDSQARVLLDRLAIQPGWKVVDVGCGPLGILHLLSERVGPEGQVIGVERERHFAEMARSEVKRRNLKNVTVIETDALENHLEKGAFDLVHERLVTINVSEREKFVAELTALLRPGGTVVLEDVDNVSWLCEPSHPSWNTLLQAFHAAFRAHGGDPFVGRRLPALLRGAGVEHVEVAMQAGLAVPGAYSRTHLISLIDSMREKIISLGLLNGPELTGHRDALSTHLENPQTMVIDKLMVQAWGYKPK